MNSKKQCSHCKILNPDYMTCTDCLKCVCSTCLFTTRRLSLLEYKCKYYCTPCYKARILLSRRVVENQVFT